MTLVVGILLVVLAAALLTSAFFSAAEVAIFSMRSNTLKSLQARQGAAGKWIGEVKVQPRRFLVTILFGNAIANAVVACVVSILFHELGQDWWGSLIVTVALLLIMGELVPKAVATQFGSAIAVRSVIFLRALEWTEWPIAGTIDHLTQRWVSKISPGRARPLQGLTEDEYVTMLDVGTREGTLRSSEKKLIERTLQLAERNLRELMTPRLEMCCVDVELELPEMKKLAARMHHRRMPLFSGSLDSVVGILNTRRLLLEPEKDIIDCIEPPAFVAETMTALELLKNFLRGPQRMAMVVDEFGGVEGLITLEDVVEEIFGEIYDEYDADAPAWEQIEPNVYLARGFAHLPALSQWLKVDLEADGIDTLGGWITDKLGILPHVGDRVSHEGYVFQVEKMFRLRVDTVLVRREREKA